MKIDFNETEIQAMEAFFRGDGALALILTGYCEKNGLEEQSNIAVDL